VATVRTTQRFSRVDRDKTAVNAENILIQYPHRKVMAMSRKSTLESPSMDGMPKSPSVSNHTDDQIINYLENDDKQFCDRCEKIINTLLPQTAVNDKWPIILKMRYVTLKPSLDDVIMERVGYQSSQYYEAVKDALCAFAEWWPSYPGSLVVSKF
jgi:ArpU family phage transcriptional regulator